MTYTRIKKIIQSGRYNREDMLGKLDVFLLSGRITIQEYDELAEMME